MAYVGLVQPEGLSTAVVGATTRAQNSFNDIAAKNSEVGMIKFTSVASGKEVNFPAFVTSFNDNFTVSFGGDTVFGRNDPVKHYQSTSRQIQASFDILGDSKARAKQNFQKYSELIKMCYPVYSSQLGSSNLARTIKAPPLWRIKYANYISRPDGNGLLGCISGISFIPNFEAGHFIDDNKMLPLVYSMSFNFEPLHETTLGFTESGRFLEQTFPYGFQQFIENPPPIPGSVT